MDVIKLPFWDQAWPLTKNHRAYYCMGRIAAVLGPPRYLFPAFTQRIGHRHILGIGQSELTY